MHGLQTPPAPPPVSRSQTNTHPELDPPSVQSRSSRSFVDNDPGAAFHQHDTTALPYAHAGNMAMAFNPGDASMLPGMNWISPSYNFDITGLDFDLTGTVDWEPSPAFVQQPMPFAPPAQLPPGSDTTPAADGTVAPTAGRSDSDGLYYADDTGARRPRNGHFSAQPTPSTSADTSITSPSMINSARQEPDDFWFPLQSPETPSSASTGQTGISSAHMELIDNNFIALCLSNHSVEDGVFKSNTFPSGDTVSTYIRSYRQFFDPRVLPMIHPDLCAPEHSNWQLTIAMAGIGSIYTTSDEQTGSCLHEFVRRGLKSANPINAPGGLTARTVGILQAMVLNYIFIAYYGSRRLSSWRLSSLNGLRTAFLDIYGRYGVQLKPGGSRTTYSESDWHQWVVEESLRRTLYVIWLLDCMACYHFDDKPLLLLDYADIALPCREPMWESPTCTTWKADYAPSSSLEEVLRTLYVEKRLVKGTGHFARVLVIHGLYCQNWTVAKSLQPNLLRWTPSARKGDANAAALMESVWLPGEPMFRDWRNSSCDCLDVLHWIGNSDIAKSGTENTTILNLHLSRIVLLAPFVTIRRLARQIIHDDPYGSDFRPAEATIRKWIFEDQYKARLAMIHCGVFLWHVRRYSTQTFYEPDDVFMVVLTVWAYSRWGPPRVTHRASRGAPGADYGNDQTPSDTETAASIRLDRPTDDELVQLYIKQGRSMIATIAGVGEITSPKAPAKMLREGCRVLATLNRWSRARILQAELTQLLSRSTND